MEYIKWGTIVMAVLILFALLDDTARRQIHGKKNTDEEDAKERNPFIK